MAQGGQGTLPEDPQDLDVAPLALDPVGTKGPLLETAVSDQAGQDLLDRRDPHAEAGRRLPGHERPVGPAPPAHQLEQGIVDRGEEGVRQTGRQRHPQPVAIPTGVLTGDQPVLAGDPHPDGPTIGQQLGRLDARPDPRRQLGVAQVAQPARRS